MGKISGRRKNKRSSSGVSASLIQKSTVQGRTLIFRCSQLTVHKTLITKIKYLLDYESRTNFSNSALAQTQPNGIRTDQAGAVTPFGSMRKGCLRRRLEDGGRGRSAVPATSWWRGGRLRSAVIHRRNERPATFWHGDVHEVSTSLLLELSGSQLQDGRREALTRYKRIVRSAGRACAVRR